MYKRFEKAIEKHCIEQDIEMKSKEIIDNMLKQGFKHDVISSITGKSIEEIKK